jgi:hypothetical protein
MKSVKIASWEINCDNKKGPPTEAAFFHFTCGSFAALRRRCSSGTDFLISTSDENCQLRRTAPSVGKSPDGL